MIFIGDLYQLSPVAKADEWHILSEHYEGIYFFHSRVIQDAPPVYVEFDKIYRQSDNDFIHVLNEVRNNTLSQEGYNLLQGRYNPSFTPNPDENYITLTTHNSSADLINYTELEKIPTESHLFNAVVKGEFPENAYPVERQLVLKEGAKVMFTRNDNETPRRYYNGKVGTITQIDNDVVTVYCPGDTEEITVDTSMGKYPLHPTRKTKPWRRRSSAPSCNSLQLAWAITIHKSQGLTFNYAIIDAGKAFSPGQVYVA